MNIRCGWFRFVWHWRRDESRQLPRAVQNHLAHCLACAAYVARYEELDRQLARPWNPSEMPEELWANLEREWLRSKAGPVHEEGRPRWSLAVAMGVVLILFFIGARGWIGQFLRQVDDGVRRPPMDAVVSADLSWMHSAVTWVGTVGECVESPDFGLRQLMLAASRRWLPWVPEEGQPPTDVWPTASGL